MVNVSPATAAALDELSVVFRAAEARLRKMPAHSKASVGVSELLGHFDPTQGGYYLVTEEDLDNEIECRMAVAYYPEYGDRVFEKWLDEYPVAKRVELAKWIPRLFEVAKECEDEVAEEIRQVVADIEQAIAEAD